MSELVEESQKTKKARRKLQARLELFEKKITPEALKRKAEEISKWIERHAHERVAIEKKDHEYH